MPDHKDGVPRPPLASSSPTSSLVVASHSILVAITERLGEERLRSRKCGSRICLETSGKVSTNVMVRALNLPIDTTLVNHA